MISCELTFYIRVRLIAPQYFSSYSGDLVCIIINHFLAYISVGKSGKYFNLDKSTAADWECILTQTDVPKISFWRFSVKMVAHSAENTPRATAGQKLSISQQC